MSSSSGTGARRRSAEAAAAAASDTGPADAAVSQNPTGEEAPQSIFPGPGLRGLISLAIVAHGFCLLLALSSNLAPSYLQGRLLDVVGPYLHGTHQYYHALPLELTRAEPLDFPLRVELQVETLGSDAQQDAAEWQPLVLQELFENGGMLARGSDVRWLNLSRWLTLVSSADPESEVLSDFAAQAVRLAEKQAGQRYRAVRFVAPKILSYDEDLALAGNLRDPEDELFQSSVMYSASIVRLSDANTAGKAGEARLSLIPAQHALRTAKPVVVAEELP